MALVIRIDYLRGVCLPASLYDSLPRICLLVSALAALAVTGCSSLAPAPADWAAWQARRNESIGGTNGWTTLVGLHWLKEGDNSAGRDPANQVVLRPDQIPASIGIFTRNGHSVSFTAASGADVQVDGKKVDRLELKSDASGEPTRLRLGSVTIVAIERGERIGLRVRDPEAAARRQFRGLRWFPYDPAWRVEGWFAPFAEPKRLRVPDVTGATQEFVSPGSVVFRLRGVERRLDVVEEPGASEFFILFHDQTAGNATYDAGRFLYVAKPAADGRVVIDFNRAFTPPCGYTAFATCPLPPSQNWLPVAVKAGELGPKSHP